MLRPLRVSAVTVLVAVAVCSCARTADRPAAIGWTVMVTATSRSPKVPAETLDAGDGSGDPVGMADLFMTTVADHSGTPQQWWARVAFYLTPSASAALAGAAPEAFPITRITGSSRLLPAQVENAAAVLVPTDAGDYTVELTRTAPGQSWYVSRLLPPAGQR
jgi:hypothetical protein